jgi:hypothetical protein
VLVAVQHLQDDVVIDAIGSASAGSITGVLAARALLLNEDPVALMVQAWVERCDISDLLTHSPSAPLSGDALDTIATDLLGQNGPTSPGGSAQLASIKLSMALTNLAGLSYDIPTPTGDAVTAATYLDWYDIELQPNDPPTTYASAARFALASGANPIAFPPRWLDRTSDDQAYRAAGLEGFPADGHFWYTDGGTVNNEPIGRTIDVVQSMAEPEGRRLHLLIHPDQGPRGEDTPNSWVGETPQPSWTRTGSRAFSISRTQSIYDDLRRLQKINSYLEWSKLVSKAVIDGVEDAGLSAEDKARVSESLTSAANAALESVRKLQDETANKAQRNLPQRRDPESDLQDLLTQLVGASTGLEARDPIAIDVICPAVDTTVDTSANEQLAGEFLFHFGGFLDVDLRKSDFALGYRNARTWLSDRLTTFNLDVARVAGALQAVEERYDDLGWDNIHKGDITLTDLPLKDKWEAAKLAMHVAHVVIHDLHSQEP